MNPDPSARLVAAYRAAEPRMAGLNFVNTALAVEAIGFAPWEEHWLGVLLTPWFMNLVLAPRNPAAWPAVVPGAKDCFRFPAGDYDFIGARDATAGDYRMCSLFSPVLEITDQETARLVAQLAREALFDPENAERPEMPVGNLTPVPADAEPRPLAVLEQRLTAPLSKRELLFGRRPDGNRGDRG